MIIDTEAVYAAYSRINPRDRRDVVWFMSEDTLARWIAEIELDRRMRINGDRSGVRDIVEFSPVGNRLFGHPIEVDNSVPYGEFRVSAETQRERELRRLARDGIPVNVIKAEPLVWSSTPAPTPTLKALIKHWLRRR